VNIAATWYGGSRYFPYSIVALLLSQVIWTGFIHNPNKDFTDKATAFIEDWETYPITTATTKDAAAQTWKSAVSLPLSMFNVESPEGTEWRMNFFRTYYQDDTSEQEYGAWNPNKLIR